MGRIKLSLNQKLCQGKTYFVSWILNMQHNFCFYFKRKATLILSEKIYYTYFNFLSPIPSTPSDNGFLQPLTWVALLSAPIALGFHGHCFYHNTSMPSHSYYVLLVGRENAGSSWYHIPQHLAQCHDRHSIHTYWIEINLRITEWQRTEQIANVQTYWLVDCYCLKL